MHIPDGFLTVEVWGLLYIVTIAVLAIAFRKTAGKLGDKQVPLMGILAAFIFAGQMLNVPVLGGTSGHILGGVLAAVLLGPYSASIIMASVFFVQALVFQDGGITALGANIFNMGLIGTILGYYFFIGLRRMSKNMFASAAVAAWLAIVLAATAASLEIAASGRIAIAIVLPAMLGVHAIIGIVEAAVTISILGLISKSRPDLLKLDKI
jgi:cobalt/nickel transport system permease protein